MTDFTPEQIDAAAVAAANATETCAALPAPARAQLLRALADAMSAARDVLVPLADEETSLGTARLNGEIERTAFQLRGFAERTQAAFEVVDEAAVAGAPPAGRPRLTRVRVPVGPVAMFAASNFPFAFSVLGGDTASALAAGCPVVVKAHPAHPRLSRAVRDIAHGVVAQLLAGSVAQGCGQFCISPGIVLLFDGPGQEVFGPDCLLVTVSSVDLGRLRRMDRFLRPVALQDAPDWLLALEGQPVGPV